MNALRTSVVLEPGVRLLTAFRQLLTLLAVHTACAGLCYMPPGLRVKIHWEELHIDDELPHARTPLGSR